MTRWFLVSGALIACGGKPMTVLPVVPPAPGLVAEVRFADVPGAPVVLAPVRATHAETQVGLMYRKDALRPQEGMLFAFPDDTDRSFWMKNTYIGLDLLYLDAQGKLVGIAPDVPPLTENSRTVGVESRFVLEVGAGWARQHGVQVGMVAGITLRHE